MKFLLFIPIIVGLVFAHIAYADKMKCEAGFFYSDGECFRYKLSNEQRTILQNHIDFYQKIATESLIFVNDIAEGIENKNRASENANIEKVAEHTLRYIDDSLAFEKSVGKEIKKDKIRKGKNRRYDKHGILGISIYKSTFELYEIFDEADLFRISKRDITAKHGKLLDKLNYDVTTAVDNYGVAYINGSDDLEEYRKAVAKSIKASVKALADIYADEIAKLPPHTLGKIKEARKEVLEDALENVYEDYHRFQRKMNKHRHD